MAQEDSTKSPIRLLVAYDNAQELATLARFVEVSSDGRIQVVGQVTDGDAALKFIEKEKPDVALIPIELPVLDGITLTDKVTFHNPPLRTKMILLTTRTGDEQFHKGMLAGAKDILMIPFEENEPMKTIESVHAQKRPIHVQRSKSLTSDGHTVNKRIISVTGAGGGVGKSNTALNIAVCLAIHGHSTLLIDLDIATGRIDMLLGLEASGKNIGTLIHYACVGDEKEGYDASLIPEYIDIHEDSKLHVLRGPCNPDFLFVINFTHLVWILEYAKRHYDYVVVEVPPLFEDAFMAVLAMSDPILLVTTPDVPTATRTLRWEGKLREHLKSENPNFIQYVLNKGTTGYDEETERELANASAVEDAMNRKFVGILPLRQRKVSLANSKGIPMYIGDGNGTYSTQIIKLTEAITQIPMARPEESLLDWVLGRKTTNPGI